MKEKKIIEFVCSANKGRSVPAELIGREHIRSKGLIDRLDTASSGSHVNDFFAPIEQRKPEIVTYTLGLALKRDDILKPEEYAFAQRVIKGEINPKSDEAVRLYLHANQIFVNEEEQRRERELHNNHINETPKDTKEQSIPLANRIGVFSMAPSNNAVIEGIYLGSGYNPTISVLSQYALRDPKAQLPNAFGAKDPAVYANTISALRKEVPLVIDRLIEERGKELGLI